MRQTLYPCGFALKGRQRAPSALWAPRTWLYKRVCGLRGAPSGAARGAIGVGGRLKTGPRRPSAPSPQPWCGPATNTGSRRRLATRVTQRGGSFSRSGSALSPGRNSSLFGERQSPVRESHESVGLPSNRCRGPAQQPPAPAVPHGVLATSPLSSRVHRQLVPGLQHVAAHRRAHDAGADPAKGHEERSATRRSVLRRE